MDNFMNDNFCFDADVPAMAEGNRPKVSNAFRRAVRHLAAGMTAFALAGSVLAQVQAPASPQQAPIPLAPPAPAAPAVPSGSTGSSVAAQRVVVLNSADASLSLIDMATQQEIKRYSVGKEPHHLMPTPDNRTLIIANAASNDLMLLDPLSGEMRARIPKIVDPYQIGFSPDQKFFVATALRLDHVDIYQHTAGANGPEFKLLKRLGTPSTPSHMAFTADNRWVFITLQGSDQIAAIDLTTQTVAWTLPVGSQPAGIFLTPDQKHLLVGIMGQDFVEVIDWRAQKTVSRIVTGKGAHNFRGLGDRKHVLVSNRVSSTVSILDYTTFKVVDQIPIPGGPDCMEVTPDGKTLWATTRFNRQVAVVDIPSRKVLKTIKVGRSPHGIYFHERAAFY